MPLPEPRSIYLREGPRDIPSAPDAPPHAASIPAPVSYCAVGTPNQGWGERYFVHVGDPDADGAAPLNPCLLRDIAAWMIRHGIDRLHADGRHPLPPEATGLVDVLRPYDLTIVSLNILVEQEGDRAFVWIWDSTLWNVDAGPIPRIGSTIGRIKA